MWIRCGAAFRFRLLLWCVQTALRPHWHCSTAWRPHASYDCMLSWFLPDCAWSCFPLPCRCAWVNHSSDPHEFINLVQQHPNIRLWFRWVLRRAGAELVLVLVLLPGMWPVCPFKHARWRPSADSCLSGTSHLSHIQPIAPLRCTHPPLQRPLPPEPQLCRQHQRGGGHGLCADRRDWGVQQRWLQAVARAQGWVSGQLAGRMLTSKAEAGSAACACHVI